MNDKCDFKVIINSFRDKYNLIKRLQLSNQLNFLINDINKKSYKIKEPNYENKIYY